MHNVRKMWNPLYRHPPIWLCPHLYIFLTPSSLTINVDLMIYGVNTKINSWGKVIRLCLEDHKTMSHAFFITNTFICNTRLWFDSKQKQSHVLKGVKRKINIAYEILAEYRVLLLQNPYISNESVYITSIDNASISITRPFFQENLEPTLPWFFETLNPYT